MLKSFCLCWILEESLQNAVHILSCFLPLQVGEFYETFGLDAVLLMQFCGLNPMGNRDPPAAGLPLGNIRRTTRELVKEYGLSVVSLFSQPPNLSVKLPR